MVLRKLLIPALALISSCSTTISKEERDQELVPPAELDATGRDAPLRSSMFLRSHYNYANVSTQPIRARGVPLYQILELAAPGYTMMPMDSAVNIYRPITMSSEGVSLDRLLGSLASMTGYDLKVVGMTVEVHAFVSKEWLLPMFSADSSSTASVSGATSSSGGSGGSGGGGSGSGGGGAGGGGGGGGGRSISASFRNEVQDWSGIVKYAETLLGASAGTTGQITVDATGSVGEITPGRPATTPQIVANRALGYIRAYGEAGKVKAVDEYITGIVKFARKQVRLDVRSVEVSFNNNKARSINWNAAINTIFNNALGSAGVSLGADYTVAGAVTDGSFNIGAQAQSADDSINTMINFLASYGTVEIRNNPQVTVFNGRTAYIGSGEEFGYVASVEQTVSNGTVVATPEIARILIGVELAITPRVVDGNNILLEVVPIISTFRGFDTFTIGDSTFSQPRIVLNQLATQVIVQSGKPIHLGGLLTSRINEAIKGLPLEQGSLIQRVLGPVFSGKQNSIERRELMLVVTPYLTNT